MTTGCAERNGTDTIEDKLFHQFAACHARITDGEIETVGNRLVQIMVIDNLKTILGKYLL